MKVIDPGHKFELDMLDALGPHLLTFVKREGPGYPGNKGHYGGVNLQEVYRACISRVGYLDGQEHCEENNRIILYSRQCIRLLEERAARRHGRLSPFQYALEEIEKMATCVLCGHIGCTGSCR